MPLPKSRPLLPTLLGLALVVGVGAGVLTLPTAASVSTVSITTRADSYTRADAPRRNFGTSPRWSTDGRPKVRRHAFLKFDVPAAPAGTKYVTATLRAFSSSAASTGAGVAVHRTTNAWAERRITWRNQPGAGALVATASGFGNDSWVSWDVSAAVRSSGGRVSFRLQSAERRWLGFASRQDTDGVPPRLVLTTGPASTPTSSPTSTPSTPQTAAQMRGWGAPVAGDEFGYTGAPDPSKWAVYDSPGHNNKGLRSPDAWQVNGAVARVSGDANGTTGGMAAKFDRRKYGRWEVRMRTNARDPEYHPVLLLWPDSENWPCDGEIDFAEGTDDVGRIGFYHHYSCDNKQTSASRAVDTTQWHHYAVEWTPDAVVGYLDGVEWFRDTDPAHQPPGPMHNTVQLDWFPDGTSTAPSWMEVDWVRVYNVPQSPSPSPTATSTAPTSPTSPPSSGDIRLAALGDINHDGNSSTTSREGKLAASIAAWDPTAITVLGDFQYQYGDCASLVGEFDATGWGALMSRVIGTAGSTHDYTSTPSTAADYSRHMEGTCPGQVSGPSLSAQRWTRTIQPYEPHFVDLGAWTVISMPSAQFRSGYNTAYGTEWSGTSLTSWLDSAIVAAKGRGDHVAVIDHEPYWTSGTSGHSETEGDALKPWIEVMDKYDVPLVLSGHQHNYERFHPQNADSTRNDATGTQQLQVSTGGIGLRAFNTTAPNSAVKDSSTYGWLQLVLRANGSYDWRFVPTEGTFTDAGSRPAPSP